MVRWCTTFWHEDRACNFGGDTTMRLWTKWTALALIGLAAGCGKPRLNVDASFDVEPGGHLLIVEPASREQEIQVSGTATGASVNVYIYLEKNKAAAQNEIFSKKFGSTILAKQDSTEKIDLRATI